MQVLHPFEVCIRSIDRACANVCPRATAVLVPILALTHLFVGAFLRMTVASLVGFAADGNVLFVVILSFVPPALAIWLMRMVAAADIVFVHAMGNADLCVSEGTLHCLS